MVQVGDIVSSIIIPHLCGRIIEVKPNNLAMIRVSRSQCGKTGSKMMIALEFWRKVELG